MSKTLVWLPRSGGCFPEGWSENQTRDDGLALSAGCEWLGTAKGLYLWIRLLRPDGYSWSRRAAKILSMH